MDKAIIIGPEGFTNGIFGDQRYRAPEVIQGKPYTSKADMWSLGVIMYFLLAGEHPFEKSSSSLKKKHTIQPKSFFIKLNK